MLLSFTTLESDFGYYVNQVHLLITSAVGFAGIVGIEMLSQTIKNGVWVQTEATGYLLDELDEFFEKTSNDKFELKIRVRDILAKVTDSDHYLQKWTDLFYWKFLVQPALLVVSVGTPMFLFLVVS